jgi:hypothetical protein
VFRNAHVASDLVLFLQGSNRQQSSEPASILSYERNLFLKLPCLRRGLQESRDESLNRFRLVKDHDALLAYDLILSPAKELLGPETVRGDYPLQIARYSRMGSIFSL